MEKGKSLASGVHAADVSGRAGDSSAPALRWLTSYPTAADRAAHAEIANQRARFNISRLRLVLPPLAALHWAFAAFLRWSRPLVATGDLASVSAWQREASDANALMGAVVFLVAAVAWTTRRAVPAGDWRRYLPGVGGAAYLVYAAWITGIDQRVAPGLTAFIVAALGVAMVLRLPAAIATAVYAGGLVTLLAALSGYQPSPPLRLSLTINGTLVAALGWLLTVLLDRALVRDILSRRTIAAQQRDLAAVNADLARSLAALQRANVELEREIQVRTAAETELERLATRDPLTDTVNRRRFIEIVELEAARDGRPLALAMVDIDNFKVINDRFGHAFGDAALRQVVGRCTEILRETDVVGRLGGDEFAILCIGSDLQEASRITERLRATLSTRPLSTREGLLRLTASVGVTDLVGEPDAVHRALQRADEALYEAKRAGRDRVIVRPAPRHAATIHPTEV